jgi:hypothetical protein
MVPLAQGVGGFVLGAVMTIALGPLGLAIALLLAGILVWARVRHQDVSALTPGAVGYLVAAAAYVALVVVANVG